MKILYVEDNETNIALVARIIRIHDDNTLDTFHRAEDALDYADLNSYDVILTDINLGADAMNGLDFTSYLRGRGITTPVIALSAEDLSAHQRQTAVSGLDYFVPKPVIPQELLRLLEELHKGV